jgi:hypothetical protein
MCAAGHEKDVSGRTREGCARQDMRRMCAAGHEKDVSGRILRSDVFYLLHVRPKNEFSKFQERVVFSF